jgi:hypothetical protein
MSLKIFVSHSSKYRDLAVKLKLSLQALEAEAHLDIRISEDMAGAKNWRQWIEENVRSSDIFLLLYPHAGMDMGWCNYELGRFYNEDMDGRYIVCIRNTDIKLPPPAFQPYQSYEASLSDLNKFLNELFVKGTFTRGMALNKDVGAVGTDLYVRAREVCEVLAAQFAEARIEERFYENRVVITLRYDGGERLNEANSMIHGNTEGLGLLGQVTEASWATLKAALGPSGEWLTELQAALPVIVKGALPPALPPYRAKSGDIYLPIVVRAEIGDGLPRQLSVIFVSAGLELLRPMLGWSFPRSMPQGLVYLVLLFRSMFKARWDILEPSYQEVHFKAPKPDAPRRKEIAQAVLRQYEEMQRASESEVPAGIGQFFAAFRKDLHPEVEASIDEWMGLMKRLHDATETERDDLDPVLKDLMANNTRWLSVTQAQFADEIAHLR